MAEVSKSWKNSPRLVIVNFSVLNLDHAGDPLSGRNNIAATEIGIL